MPVELNHTIVAARDPRASAAFLAEILGLPAPVRFGHFEVTGTLPPPDACHCTQCRERPAWRNDRRYLDSVPSAC